MEKPFLLLVFLIVAVLSAWDIVGDWGSTGFGWHVGLEALLLLAASAGFVLVLRQWLKLRRQTSELRQDLARVSSLNEQYRQEVRQFAEGLQGTIDRQMDRWKLSEAEKQVAYLLIKGFSSKEVADLRNTSEKTVRQQCTQIYRKANLEGRADLAAFFLEDLLSPSGQDPKIGYDLGQDGNSKKPS